MSSFRIDRQYVSFQTAETQPVRATPQAQKPKPEVTAELNERGVDISKIYNEVYERLLSEHAEQAEYMLSKASDEAQEIVEKAKKEADELRARAKSDAEKLREELRASAENAAQERKAFEEQELQNMVASLQNSYGTMIDGMQNEIVALVMEIVRKVIGIKISQSDEVFLGLVRDALERLKQTGSVIIRVSSGDYARYFGAEHATELDTGEMKVAVVEEPEFKTNDLVVESEGEIVDLSVDRQLDQIEQAFLN
jgi:flagellar assembly protein FliH